MKGHDMPTTEHTARAARPLSNITADDLAPIWARKEITVAKIAQSLGVTRQAVSYKAKALGLPSRAGNYEAQKKSSDEVFARMWNAGVLVDHIASHLGYTTRMAVATRRSMMGLAPRVRGVDGWSKAITIEEYREIEMGRLMQEMQQTSPL